MFGSNNLESVKRKVLNGIITVKYTANGNLYFGFPGINPKSFIGSLITKHFDSVIEVNTPLLQ